MKYQHWQESWRQATEYWAAHWKSWLPVLAVLSLWFWIILLVVPSTTPFMFIQFQPINDKTVVRTYHRQLTQLLAHMPLLVIMVIATTVVGGIIVARMLRRRTGRQVALSSLWVLLGSSGMTAALSFMAMAAVEVPLSSTGGSLLSEIVRGIIALAVLVIAVPYAFWAGTLKLNRRGSFWMALRSQRRDTLFLPWTWLLGLVAVQMLSASFAWTTTVNAIGTLLLSVFTMGCGLLFQSVAYFYTRPGVVQDHLRKTS